MGSQNVSQNNAACLNISEAFADSNAELTSMNSVKNVFIASYALVFIIGIVGNCGTLLAAISWNCRGLGLPSPQNLFIASLCISGLTMLFFSATITPAAALAKTWNYGPILCRVPSTVQAVCTVVNSYSLLTLAVNRYTVIALPGWRKISRSQSLFTILVIWLFAAFLTAPLAVRLGLSSHAVFLSTSGQKVNVCGVFCIETWPTAHQGYLKAYSGMIFMASFFVPLAVITFCNGAMIWKLKQLPSFGSNSADTSSRSSSNRMQLPGISRRRVYARQLKRQRRTNLMMVLMVLAFMLSSLPLVLYNLLKDFNIQPTFIIQQTNFYQLLAHLLSMSSTILNPLIYGWLNTQLRREFLSLLPPSMVPPTWSPSVDLASSQRAHRVSLQPRYRRSSPLVRWGASQEMHNQHYISRRRNSTVPPPLSKQPQKPIKCRTRLLATPETSGGTYRSVSIVTEL